MMNFVLKMMDFVLTMMDLALKMTGEPRAAEVLLGGPRGMSVLEMMNSVLEMMNFVFEMMNSATW